MCVKMLLKELGCVPYGNTGHADQVTEQSWGRKVNTVVTLYKNLHVYYFTM